MRWYALAQRPWIEEDGFGYWGQPPGTIGSVDLAPAGGTSHLFVTSDAPFDPADVTATFGDRTRLDSYVPTAEEQSAWQSLVGVACQPGWTLLDLLWATLTSEADPDGLTRAKPIMPTHRGVLELHLGGHSLVRTEKLPGDPTMHRAWPNIQRVLQNDYRAIRARDRTRARKWLGAQQLRFRLSPEAARDLLIPADLPREMPLRPTTELTDDFNRADQTGLGTSVEGWSWVNQSGGFSIADNQAQADAPSVHRLVRADTALSSDDNYSQATITSGLRDGGPIARLSSGSNTGYSAWVTGNTLRIYKVDAFSALASKSMGLANSLLKMECDGSTLRAYVNGNLELTVTDTDITSGAYAGLNAWNQSTFDDFEAADLLAEAELVRVRSETLGTGEAQTRARGRTSAYDEGLVIDQLVQRLRELARRHGESVALAEMSTVARALLRLRSETAGLTETTAFVVEALAEALVRVLADTVAMAEAVARPRRLTRFRADLVGMAGAVARVGGFVSAAVPINTDRIRMRVGPSVRMKVPPAQR